MPITASSDVQGEDYNFGIGTEQSSLIEQNKVNELESLIPKSKPSD